MTTSAAVALHFPCVAGAEVLCISDKPAGVHPSFRSSSVAFFRAFAFLGIDGKDRTLRVREGSTMFEVADVVRIVLFIILAGCYESNTTRTYPIAGIDNDMEILNTIIQAN